MAKSLSRSAAFKSSQELQSYYLDNVIPTGKTLGVGSFGSVVEVSSS